jgi:alkanesulfonate monooxygenase
MLRYYRLGIHSFLIRGFDPVSDVTDYGRELIPRLRLGAREVDAAMEAST